MLRLEIAGMDTLATTPRCASCSHSPAGCCAAPPRIALADVARIVRHGGRDFLLEELRDGRLRIAESRGFLLYPRRPHATGVLACGYLGPGGCVLPPHRRSSTCNTYVCDEALDEDPDVHVARRTRDERDRLERTFARWDELLAERVAARFPDGPPWDASFLDWLGDELTKLATTARVTP